MFFFTLKYKTRKKKRVKRIREIIEDAGRLRRTERKQEETRGNRGINERKVSGGRQEGRKVNPIQAKTNNTQHTCISDMHARECMCTCVCVCVYTYVCDVNSTGSV